MEKIELRRQREMFDLATMDEVTVVKIGEFTPVATYEEALSRVGNDTAKFLEIVNEGLEAKAGRDLINDNSVAWQEEDEEGKLAPFSGTMGNKKAVNNLILTLAKTIFGFGKGMSKEEKKSAKESAKDLIRGTDSIKQGLIKNASVEQPDADGFAG